MIEGMPTVLPFHRAVLDDPAFTAADGDFGVHTRWIETEFDNPDRSRTRATVGGRRAGGADQGAWSRSTASGSRWSCRPGSEPATGRVDRRRAAKKPVRAQRRRRLGAGQRTLRQRLTSPMQGTVVKVAVADGDLVEAGDLVVVLEAMKMEQPLTAHRSGKVANLARRGGRHRDQRLDPLRDRRLTPNRAGGRPRSCDSTLRRAQWHERSTDPSDVDNRAAPKKT